MGYGMTGPDLCDNAKSSRYHRANGLRYDGSCSRFDRVSILVEINLLPLLAIFEFLGFGRVFAEAEFSIIILVATTTTAGLTLR